jgi:hypothetical protein
MNFYVMLFIALLLSAVNGQLCDRVTCSDNLCGSVYANFIWTDIYCNSFTTCNYTNADFTNGTCIPYPSLGQSCLNTDNICGIGLQCNRDTYICQAVPAKVGYLTPGSSCTQDSQCSFSGDSTGTCTNGKCKSLPQGGSCTGANQCINGTYCDSSTRTCTTNKQMGSACNVSASSPGCPSTGVCNPTTTSTDSGTCIPLRSLAAGKPCLDISSCEEGLYCTAITLSTAIGVKYGLCKAISNTTTLYQTCSTNSDCNSDNQEQCSCSPIHRPDGTQVCVPPYVTPVGLTEKKTNFDTCVNAKGCVFNVDTTNNSCAMEKCAAEMCAYYPLDLTNNEQNYNKCFLRNTVTNFCKNLPSENNSATFSISYVICLVGALFVLL